MVERQYLKKKNNIQNGGKYIILFLDFYFGAMVTVMSHSVTCTIRKYRATGLAVIPCKDEPVELQYI